MLDKDILDALKNLAKETGETPSFHEIAAASKAGKCPSPGTVVKRIGKLSDLRSRFDFLR